MVFKEELIKYFSSKKEYEEWVYYTPYFYFKLEHAWRNKETKETFGVDKDCLYHSTPDEYKAYDKKEEVYHFNSIFIKDGLLLLNIGEKN